MRKSNFKITYTFLCFLCFFSCKQEQKNSILISGLITNTAGIITITSDNLDITTKATIKLHENGSFADTLSLKKGNYVINDGVNGYIPIYLEPNKVYHIQYDASTFTNNGAILKGEDDININNYYIEKRRKRLFFNPTGNGKSEKEFRVFLKELRNNQLYQLERSNFPIQLKRFETKEINYAYLRYLYLYLVLNDIENPSKDSLDDLNINYLNEKDFKTHGDFRGLVYEYFSQKLLKREKTFLKSNANYNRNTSFFKDISSIITSNDYIKNKVIESSGLYSLKYSSNIESTFEDFKKYYTGSDSIFRLKMFDLYHSFSTFKKGNPSPKFVNFKNFKGGVNSLDDFKGKFIYIDFWSSSCLNCFVQFPYLKRLESKLHEKNIVFISISRENEKDWKKTIIEKKLSGVHLLANNNDFHNAYAVYGIPRYIFIDPKGNIIDHNAPRPSEKRLETLFIEAGLL